jgi:hypothetical protein
VGEQRGTEKRLQTQISDTEQRLRDVTAQHQRTTEEKYKTEVVVSHFFFFLLPPFRLLPGPCSRNFSLSLSLPLSPSLSSLSPFLSLGAADRDANQPAKHRGASARRPQGAASPQNRTPAAAQTPGLAVSLDCRNISLSPALLVPGSILIMIPSVFCAHVLSVCSMRQRWADSRLPRRLPRSARP